MMRRCALAFFVFLTLADGFQQDEGDAARISTLVQRFFQAIARKDLDGATALLAVDSPSFVNTREELRGFSRRIGSPPPRPVSNEPPSPRQIARARR